MSYLVKEIFYSLQGEGFHSGRPAVFCRFAGCNLWSGNELDRNDAGCNFCDTDFAGMPEKTGGEFADAQLLAEKIEAAWPFAEAEKFVVCTGGEPLLQLDENLLAALHDLGFTVAVETNGTLPAPNGIDWLCVSPKAETKLKLHQGDELKLVFPQPGMDPEKFSLLSFDHFYLQPRAFGELTAEATRQAIQYCLDHPRWKLGLQLHKILGIK